MTTLVTGGTGLLGAPLVRALAQRGERVHVLHRGKHKGEALPGVTYFHGDICDPQAVEAAVSGCDTIYHVAGIYDLWTLDKRVFDRNNVEGTWVVLETARRMGVRRAVYTSSAVTIGERPGEVGTEETIHRGYFLNEYERSKYEAEQMVRQMAREGFPVTIVNPSQIIGSGDLSPNGRFLIDLLNGRAPGVVRGVLSYVTVDDAVRGHLLAAERGQPGARYILSGETLMLLGFILRVLQAAGIGNQPPVLPYRLARTLATAFEALSLVTHRPPLANRTTLRLLEHGLMVDGNHAAKELGFSYTPLNDILPDVVRWYATRGHLKRRLPG